MKVIFLCLNLKNGGAERVISVLSNKFVEKDILVKIITLSNSEVEYELNSKIEVISIDSLKSINMNKIKKIFLKISPKRIFKLKNVIVKEKPDIIISFLPEPSFRILLLKKISKAISKIPVIMSIRNDPKVEYKSFVVNKISRSLFKYSDSIVFQTMEAMNYFKDYQLNSIMEIIPNPINDKFINHKPYVGKRDKEIVTVGRLEPQKNQRLLIDAFSKFNKVHNEYVLKIIGSGSLERDLKKYVNDKKIKNVKFLGKVNNVEEVIHKSALFVLPSDYEGMPNALMEAMALGLPCISTDCPCGGPRELIKNNINGILVPVNDENSLIDSLDFLINNEDVCNAFSENARKIAEDYNIDAISEKWIKLINKIIQGV